ncbi:MAG: hypothetical protein K9M13_02310 [Simkaniaceae bacterium]|nr:hypothetical protein [Simkaniaceae bacterium]
MAISSLTESPASSFSIDSMKAKPFYGSFERSTMIKVAIVGVAAIALISALAFIPGAPLAGIAIMSLIEAYAGATAISVFAAGLLGLNFYNRIGSAAGILKEIDDTITKGEVLSKDDFKDLAWRLSQYDESSQVTFVLDRLSPYIDKLAGIDTETLPAPIQELYSQHIGRVKEDFLKRDRGVRMPADTSSEMEECLTSARYGDETEADVIDTETEKNINSAIGKGITHLLDGYKEQVEKVEAGVFVLNKKLFDNLNSLRDCISNVADISFDSTEDGNYLRCIGLLERIDAQCAPLVSLVLNELKSPEGLKSDALEEWTNEFIAIYPSCKGESYALANAYIQRHPEPALFVKDTESQVGNKLLSIWMREHSKDHEMIKGIPLSVIGQLNMSSASFNDWLTAHNFSFELPNKPSDDEVKMALSCAAFAADRSCTQASGIKGACDFKAFDASVKKIDEEQIKALRPWFQKEWKDTAIELFLAHLG